MDTIERIQNLTTAANLEAFSHVKKDVEGILEAYEEGIREGAGCHRDTREEMMAGIASIIRDWDSEYVT